MVLTASPLVLEFNYVKSVKFFHHHLRTLLLWNYEIRNRNPESTTLRATPNPAQRWSNQDVDLFMREIWLAELYLMQSIVKILHNRLVDALLIYPQTRNINIITLVILSKRYEMWGFNSRQVIVNYKYNTKCEGCRCCFSSFEIFFIFKDF